MLRLVRGSLSILSRMRMASAARMSHKTAIKRQLVSAPARYLWKNRLIIGRALDFGCGHGKDASAYSMERYDPHYFPARPTGRFDTIVCTYVLNVLPSDKATEIISEIRALLKPDGRGYITVRRDLRRDGFTRNGTFQRNVVLEFPVLIERKGAFAIYEVR